MQLTNSLVLRVILAVILLVHSVPGMIDGGVNKFGTLYLDAIGFAPIGLYLAWLIKLSHVVCAICLLANKYVKWPGVITILIWTVGIFMVHLPDGWFVVGGGRNGIEYNILLIMTMIVVLRLNDHKD